MGEMVSLQTLVMYSNSGFLILISSNYNFDMKNFKPRNEIKMHKFSSLVWQKKEIIAKLQSRSENKFASKDKAQ